MRLTNEALRMGRNKQAAKVVGIGRECCFVARRSIVPMMSSGSRDMASISRRGSLSPRQPSLVRLEPVDFSTTTRIRLSHSPHFGTATTGAAPHVAIMRFHVAQN